MPGVRPVAGSLATLTQSSVRLGRLWALDGMIRDGQIGEYQAKIKVGFRVLGRE